ncbi:MAG: tetratricopeptide repeat protein [Candidatus Obscuribacterales bacterium]|nr:tetratricopeptide repeat protein [Candidatus Obscuribacterales bacterium]
MTRIEAHEDFAMFGEPPDVVPDDLSADEYFELGDWYHKSKKLELAREALHRSIALDSSAPSAQRARNYLDQNIPSKLSCTDTILKFHGIAMSAFSSPGRAEKQWQEMIDEHPDFEWPYRSLAESILRRTGDLDRAKALLEKALEISPEYVPALISMAGLWIADMEYDQARRCLAKARDLSNDNENIAEIQRSLEILNTLR